MIKRIWCKLHGHDVELVFADIDDIPWPRFEMMRCRRCKYEAWTFEFRVELPS